MERTSNHPGGAASTRFSASTSPHRHGPRVRQVHLVAHPAERGVERLRRVVRPRGGQLQPPPALGGRPPFGGQQQRPADPATPRRRHDEQVGELVDRLRADRAEQRVELAEAQRLPRRVLGQQDHGVAAAQTLGDEALGRGGIGRLRVELAIGVEQRRHGGQVGQRGQAGRRQGHGPHHRRGSAPRLLMSLDQRHMRPVGPALRQEGLGVRRAVGQAAGQLHLRRRLRQRLALVDLERLVLVREIAGWIELEALGTKGALEASKKIPYQLKSHHTKTKNTGKINPENTINSCQFNPVS